MTQTALADEVTKFGVPKVFKPLWVPSRYKGAHGGRGSGKSTNFAMMAVHKHANEHGVRGVCVREIQKTLKESAKKLIEDTVVRLGLATRMDSLTSEIRTPGGGTIMFQGMQDHTAESIKSFEGLDWVWIEEAQTLSARSLELLRPTLREAGSEIWASWNPRNASDPIDRLLRGIELPKRSVVVEANYFDNPHFTEELELERQHDERTNPDRYAHVWLGAYEPQALGAIWTRQVLHEGRLPEMQVDRERTLVGVDPAVTDTDVSDHHGIAVCAKGADDRGYMLEDASLKGSPHQWATRAVAMFDKWDADAIVVEINQGGDMVKHTIQTIRKSIPIIEVRATRGKHVRAEPISAMYTLGRISHIGTWPEMEDQFCKFTSSGYEGEDSPDRAEAAIWAFTELFPELLNAKSKHDEEIFPGLRQEGSWMS